MVVRILAIGEERTLTKNRNGILKSYVFFDGTLNQGLGKASVCLDYKKNLICFIQDRSTCRVDLEGNIKILNQVPDDYDAYGPFTMDHQGNLVCDGYFKYPWETKKVRNNSTDNGPDPHKKDAEYICKVIADWETGVLLWIPLCKHESDWLGQDAHPHPIYSPR